MADPKDTPPTGAPTAPKPAADAAGVKRPHAMLDLRATEVRQAETAKPDTAAAPAKSAGSEAPAKAAPAPVAETAAEGKPSMTPAASPAAAPKPAAADKRAASAPAALPPRPPSALGRLATHAFAGTIGALLALFGADWIGRHLNIPVGTTAFVETEKKLANRIAALESSAEQPGSTEDLTKRLADAEAALARVDGLRQQVTALSEAQSKFDGDVTALTARVDAQPAESAAADRVQRLEERLATIAEAAKTETGGPIAQLTAVTGKIADLETSLTGQITALRKTLPQDLEQRLGNIGETSEQAKSGITRIDKDLTAVKTDAARLTQRMEGVKTDQERLRETTLAAQEEAAKVSSSLAAISGTIAAQTKAFVKTEQVTAAVAPVAAKLANIETAIKGVMKSEADRKASTERIVVSLELANLKRAIERGGGYATELDAVRRASAGELSLADLDRNKIEGVATLPELQANLRPVIDQILYAEKHTEGQSAVDRLIASAKSVVRVRKVDHAEGDSSAEAIVSRMEKSLGEGRLADVITAAKQLPPGAAAAAAPWLEKVQARLAVDQAMLKIESELKASLADSTEPQSPAAASAAPEAPAAPAPADKK